MMKGLSFDIFAKDKTGQAFDAVKNRVRGLDDSFSKLKKAALVFGGGTAIFGWLKGAASAAEHINELSARLGVSAQVLSQYQLIAGETGVELDSIGKAMQMLAKNSVEASSGSGAASEALNKLGIDALNFKNLSIDQQFALVAEKIQGIENPSERVSIAMALMGKSGAEMLQVMENGGQGLLDMQRKADSLGITLDNTTTGAIDSMMDAFGNLGLQVMALGQHLLSKFAPIIEFIAETLQVVLAGAIIIVRDGFRAAIQVIINFIGTVVKGLGFLTEKLSILPGEVGDTFKRLGDSLKDYGGILQSVDASTDKLVTTVKKIKPPADDAAQSLDKLSRSSRRTKDKVKSDFNEMGKAANDNAIDMRSIFKDSITDIGRDFTSLRDVASNVLNSIGQKLLEMGTNSITDALFGSNKQQTLPWLQPVGGNVLDGIFDSIGSTFGGFFATGGTLKPGQWGIAGENGAEPIFAGNTPLQVMSNRDANSMGSGSVSNTGAAPIHVTLNISTGVSQTVRAEIRNLLPQITESVKGAVADSRMRGGRFASAFEG
jgi:hypothetical protein